MGVVGEVKELLESERALRYVVTVAAALALVLGACLAFVPESLGWFGPAKPYVGVAFLISLVVAVATTLHIALERRLDRATKGAAHSAREAAAAREAMLHVLRNLSNDEKTLLANAPTGSRTVHARITSASAGSLLRKGVLIQTTNIGRGVTMEYAVSDLAYELLRADPTMVHF